MKPLLILLLLVMSLLCFTMAYYAVITLWGDVPAVFAFPVMFVVIGILCALVALEFKKGKTL